MPAQQNKAFFKGLGQCKQEENTVFRGQALHVFQGFDVLRMFVRMFWMHTAYKIRTMLTNIQPLHGVFKKPQQKLLFDEYKKLYKPQLLQQAAIADVLTICLKHPREMSLQMPAQVTAAEMQTAQPGCSLTGVQLHPKDSTASPQNIK